MKNCFKKYKSLMVVSILLIIALIFIIVISTLPKTKMTQIPPNDMRYCYNVKDLASIDDPTSYLNVTSVFKGDINKSFTDVVLSTYSENGNKVIIDNHTKNIFADIASGELVGKLEIFCLSNIDDAYYRQSVCSIKAIDIGGGIEVNFMRKKLLFRGNTKDDIIKGEVLLQYLIRIK